MQHQLVIACQNLNALHYSPHPYSMHYITTPHSPHLFSKCTLWDLYNFFPQGSRNTYLNSNDIWWNLHRSKTLYDQTPWLYIEHTPCGIYTKFFNTDHTYAQCTPCGILQSTSVLNINPVKSVQNLCSTFVHTNTKSTTCAICARFFINTHTIPNVHPVGCVKSLSSSLSISVLNIHCVESGNTLVSILFNS